MENDAVGFYHDEIRGRFDSLKGRHENGTAPKAVVAYQLFQTPAEVAAMLIQMLDLNAYERVLEPSAGLGNLIKAIIPFEPCEIVAVDVNPDCAGELYRQNLAGVTIKQRDFLDMTPADTGKFDAIAMNPPFHMRSDIKHVKHAMQFLKPGGRLAAICMDTHHRREAFESIASEWIDLPCGAFKESGTGVGTVMFKLEQKG